MALTINWYGSEAVRQKFGLQGRGMSELLNHYFKGGQIWGGGRAERASIQLV